MGKRRRKKRTHVREEDEEHKNAPRCYVVALGSVGKAVEKVMHDFRSMMEPYTSSKLKTTSHNRLRDFVAVAGPLGMTHMAAFTLSDLAPNLRLMRLPHGPTCTLRIDEYSTVADLVSVFSHPVRPTPLAALSPPLVVLRGFSTDSPRRELSLMATMFQSMFPSINIQTVKLHECRRVVFITYDDATDAFDIRHYLITVRPVGVSRAVRTLVAARVPHLGSLDDIADYILDEDALLKAARTRSRSRSRSRSSARPRPASGSASGSDSDSASSAGVPFGSESGRVSSGTGTAGDVPAADADDDDDVAASSTVNDPNAPRQNAIKLVEIGPRIRLTLLKVEAGLSDGAVLYHKYITRTQAEERKLEKAKESAKLLRARRRAKQEANVARKMARRRAANPSKRKGLPDYAKNEDDPNEDPDAEPSEAEYYREAVGEDPDPDMFSAASSRPKKRMGFVPNRWKGRSRPSSSSSSKSVRFSDGPPAKRHKRK